MEAGEDQAGAAYALPPYRPNMDLPLEQPFSWNPVPALQPILLRHGVSGCDRSRRKLCLKVGALLLLQAYHDGDIVQGLVCLNIVEPVNITRIECRLVGVEQTHCEAIRANKTHTAKQSALAHNHAPP